MGNWKRSWTLIWDMYGFATSICMISYHLYCTYNKLGSVYRVHIEVYHELASHLRHQILYYTFVRLSSHFFNYRQNYIFAHVFYLKPTHLSQL